MTNKNGYYNIVTFLTIEHSPPGKIPVAELKSIEKTCSDAADDG